MMQDPHANIKALNSATSFAVSSKLSYARASATSVWVFIGLSICKDDLGLCNGVRGLREVALDLRKVLLNVLDGCSTLIKNLANAWLGRQRDRNFHAILGVYSSENYFVRGTSPSSVTIT